jgi:protein-disulfide isomerase
MARAAADGASQAVTVELARNAELARAMGFSGTPAWIAGKKPIGGAVGAEALKTALEGSGES